MTRGQWSCYLIFWVLLIATIAGARIWKDSPGAASLATAAIISGASLVEWKSSRLLRGYGLLLLLAGCGYMLREIPVVKPHLERLPAGLLFGWWVIIRFSRESAQESERETTRAFVLGWLCFFLSINFWGVRIPWLRIFD